MPMISRELIQEYTTHRFSAFASDLGFGPGEWPSTVDASDDVGNGMPFVFQGRLMDDDEMIVGVYEQLCGCISLHVYND